METSSTQSCQEDGGLRSCAPYRQKLQHDSCLLYDSQWLYEGSIPRYRDADLLGTGAANNNSRANAAAGPDCRTCRPRSRSCSRGKEAAEEEIETWWLLRDCRPQGQLAERKEGELQGESQDEGSYCFFFGRLFCREGEGELQWRRRLFFFRPSFLQRRRG